MVTLRPSQKEILEYTSGWMGISAVPGSGKTWTISLLAADILTRGVLRDDQEILVVTLVNSAVDNFYQRVESFIKSIGLPPKMGYRVRTLHGLAHDIVRERPSVANLDDAFQIVDARETELICREAAQSWLRSHSAVMEKYLSDDLDDNRHRQVMRDQLPNLVYEVGFAFIRLAKDFQLTPEKLRERLLSLSIPLALAELGYDLYTDYQRALVYRGGVDFDDLIRLALYVLENDRDYVERLRYRWPFILEDEAQDSSRLQELILRKLAEPNGNWVRVGDPNQAIYETFTTASPDYFRNFLYDRSVVSLELPESGRSTTSIIKLANYLVDWTQVEHPLEPARQALKAPPYIQPTPPDDPQPNPVDDPSRIKLIRNKYTPQEEVKRVADSLQQWLPDHLSETVAVLVPRNQRGFDLVNELKSRNIEFNDSLLKSTSATRDAAGVLQSLLDYLSDPKSPRKLSKVFQVWRRGNTMLTEDRKTTDRISEYIKRLRQVEDYIWPGLTADWLQELASTGEPVESVELLAVFRQLVRRWQAAIFMPIDQLILTIAQDLLSDPGELALSHKLAVMLRSANQTHPTWQLPQLAIELEGISKNEQRFLGFSQDDLGFDPKKYKGIVVISTIHKAKGLEWDRVYLMSVNNYDFPSGLQYDQYIAEKLYIRDSLNLQAEALEQLRMTISEDEYRWYEEGRASNQARIDYVRERLRLLYVGITRAKRELVVTWNSGRDGNLSPAQPLQALFTFWEDTNTKTGNQ